MRLQSVEIRNFRSLVDFDLQLDGRSLTVIGENGGGKTSLLTAIARALGKDLAFTRADFADPTQPIWIRALVTDLSASQQAAFAAYAEFAAGGATLTLEARAIWNVSADEADVEHGYPKQPGSRSRRPDRDAIQVQWLAATREPRRALQFGSSQSLLAAAVAPLPLDAALDAATDAIRKAGDDLTDDPALSDFLKLAREELADLLPDVGSDAITIGSGAMTSREVLRHLDLLLKHHGEPLVVSRQSSGLAQLSVFAFAILLARADPGTILLVDEPELSLHPQSQRALMKALEALPCQVIIATHSPTLLDRADPRRVMRLKRRAAGIEVVTPSTLSDQEAARMARFMTPQTAEAFFARRVILVEGLSDQIVVEAVARQLGKNLDGQGTAVVPMGGAASIASHLRIFGPHGFELDLAGLCDEAEESLFQHALVNEGLIPTASRDEADRIGFFVCSTDLEDELVRALGAEAVEQIIEGHGELRDLRTFMGQSHVASLGIHEQLHLFLGTRSRKVEYAPLLAEALDAAQLPAPLFALMKRI